MNSKERFRYLLSKYLDGNLSGAEYDDFFDFLATGLYDDIIQAQMEKDIENKSLKFPNLPAAITKNIIDNILVDTPNKLYTNPKLKSYKSFFYYSAAAVVILVFSLLLYKTLFNDKKFFKEFVAKNPDKVLNTGQKPMSVLLPDGSQIILQSQSAVYFTKNSFKIHRNIYMQGEAFFNVTKDAVHPFSVYYGSIITNVLGTSFKIKTNYITHNIEVEVFTGKVKVFENNYIRNVSKTSVSLTVLPNLKAVYKINENSFETKLSDHPVPIKDNESKKIGASIQPVSFVFQNEKVSEVVKNLETNYGIEINVANKAINNCVFSGDITKEDLYSKLNVLCAATNSAYEISGAKISINGAGCTN